MHYEVIREIKNSCSGNQMRDVFFDEIETDDPFSWVREQEPHAECIETETLEKGVRFTVSAHGLPTVYSMTEID